MNGGGRHGFRRCMNAKPLAPAVPHIPIGNARAAAVAVKQTFEINDGKVR